MHTVIAGIITYQSFNTAYPNEVPSTPFLVLQEASQTLRGNQEIVMKQKMKTHSGAQQILQL